MIRAQDDDMKCGKCGTCSWCVGNRWLGRHSLTTQAAEVNARCALPWISNALANHDVVSESEDEGETEEDDVE